MTDAISIRDVVVDAEFKALCPPLSGDERMQLMKNIERDGFRDDIVVWSEGRILVDGHNRHEIWSDVYADDANGHRPSVKSMEFASRDSAKEWVIRNQLGRRNLNDAQRLDLILVLEPLIRDRNKERMRDGGKNKGVPNLAQASKTRDELAKLANTSHGNLDKWKAIRKSGDGEAVSKALSGEISIHKAFTDIKRQEKEAKREERREDNAKKIVTSEASPLGPSVPADARFATIVLDPPWDWGDEGDVDQLGRAKPTYKTLTIEQVESFQPCNDGRTLADLSDVDCHLYLWITNRSLPKGFRLLEAWGFRYVTCLTWCKPSFGMGNYFRGSTEQILFGVKGSQPLKRKDVGTWFQAKRGEGGHSSKPIESYELIESCSPGPYLELFARHQRSGWVCLGADA